MAAADVVDQLPRRGDGYALVRDDHQVIAIGEIHRSEQRAESLLLDVKYRAETAGRTDDVDARVGKLREDDARLLQRVQIIPDLDGPTANAPVGVRLHEMTTRVVDDVPIDAVLFDVVR